MRLRRLSLDRFGHFTDRAFDFGAAGDRPDFHIIYGPNEAGKTTAMEAALRLFYGFPNREPYAFKHGRSNLQVSGLVEIDGQARPFTRLPRRSGALVDAAGTALPEAALAAHLGGLSEGDYRHLLCLDDDTIERGGEEIAQARGDIGRLLFSAAAGVADLSEVLEQVRGEAGALWRKRASKTRVAELKRELTQVEKEIRERDVTASAWRGMKKALAEARGDETAAREARDGLRGRAVQVAARARALPLLARIDRLEREIAPCAAYPDRLDFDPESLVRLMTEESRLKADIDRLTGEIEQMTAARDGIERAPEMLDLAERLDALEDLRSRDRTAGLDIGRRRQAVAEAEAAMARAARELGAEEAEAGALVLSAAQIAQLDREREALRAAQQEAEAAARELADLTARRDRAQADYDSERAKAPPDRGLAALLSRHAADRLAPEFAKARQAVDEARDAARLARAALSVGDTRFDRLPPCPTSPARAREWAETQAETARQIAAAQEALAQHREDAAARAAQAEQLTAGGGVVSDAEAAALLAERDRLWQAHLSAMRAETAQPFEAAMTALDRAMRTRLARAGDLGQLRQVDQARAEAQARAAQVAARLDALEARQAALAEDVNAAARSAGLPTPLTPAEWLDWVERHAAAALAETRAEQVQARHRPVLDRAQQLLDALRPHLDLADPAFETALAAARDRAERERAARDDAARARAALDGLDAEHARRVAARNDRQAELEQQAAAWEGLVGDFLGPATAPETLLSSLDPLRALREEEEKRAEAAQRVAAMERDQAQFAEEIAGLAAAHGIARADSAAATFALLRNRAASARAAEARVAELTEQIACACTDLADRRDGLEEIARQAAAIGRLFPAGVAVGTLEELRHAATQAQKTIAAREQRRELETALLSELRASDLAAARQALEGATPAGLAAQADSLSADLDQAERRLTDATERRATAEQNLARVAGDAGIALLTERKATLELELEEAARAHLELSLGHRLAEEAIRRYRDSHRSGMMAATERCFAALTHGAYTQLTTRPDGEAETLLAVDATGTAKSVAEMSKGTRFQLYLALRAAAHEQLVAQGTCLPFFCDDIFETFDENRTSAACRIMEQIGRSGQAIYLTHHRHVVEIARGICDTAPFVHEIDAGALSG